ncbi:MAG: class I SAM-dependent methyltransferase [bacterium]
MEAHTRFSGTIPEIYDRHLGPVLFEPYGADLTRRVSGHPAGPVLEIACGTGLLTRRLRAHLPERTPLVATDLSKSMLDYAREKHGGIRDIEWQQADAGALPFSSASFAAIACQFGLMFVPDKKAAIRECRRVLVDGGLVALNVWDSLDHNPFARIAHETIGGFFPTDPPGFYKEGPFSFYDPKVLGDLLDTHGFAQVHIDRVTLEAHSSSAQSFAIGLVKGNPISKVIEERGASHAQIVAAVTEALTRVGGDRPFRSTMQAFVATARAAGS